MPGGHLERGFPSLCNANIDRRSPDGTAIALPKAQSLLALQPPRIPEPTCGPKFYEVANPLAY